MNIAINLLGVSLLILIFAALLIVTHYGERTKKPSVNERRTSPRYKTSLRVKYKTPLGEGVSWIKDISESGARLFLNRTLKTLEIGESLGMEIDLPSEAQSVLVQGVIVWSKEEDAGLRFDKVIEGDLNRVMQYSNILTRNKKDSPKATEGSPRRGKRSSLKEGGGYGRETDWQDNAFLRASQRRNN